MKTNSPNTFVDTVINVMLGLVVLGAGCVLFMTPSMFEKTFLFILSLLAAIGLLFRLK